MKRGRIENMINSDMDSICAGCQFAEGSSVGQLIYNSTLQHEDENQIYFYHPDHLGSSTFITDISGQVAQHVEYMAFGETFAEENFTYNTPYKFNCKELDEESGLYYYGARYYDPKTSIFHGVDPMADKNPGWSVCLLPG